MCGVVEQAAAEAAGTQAQEEQTPEKAAEDVPQGYAPVAQEQRREVGWLAGRLGLSKTELFSR